MRDTNSVNRSARSLVDQGSRSSVVASQPKPPAPMPRVKRPAERSSRVMSSRANGTGWRKVGDATRVPSRILSVTTAAAAKVGTAACQGPSRRLLQLRWS